VRSTCAAIVCRHDVQRFAAIARVQRQVPALRFGRMYFREVSEDGREFRLPERHPTTLAFSRILGQSEVLVAYNTSTDRARSELVIVDAALEPPRFRFLLGGEGTVPVLSHSESGPRFVRLDLGPMQFAVLERG
jgi:alpha-amylase